MLETPHVVIGAAIVTAIPNPMISIPLAFGSHFVLDMIPHWNPHLNTELRKYGKVTTKSRNIVILDVALALAAGFFIASLASPDTSRMMAILAGSFAAVLPDIVEGPYFFLNMRSDLISRWIKFQKSIQVDTTFISGMTTQALAVVAAFWTIFN